MKDILANKKVLISACLCGINCRFDGGNKFHKIIKELSKICILIPVCPEQLGGLPTPREISFFESGDGDKVIEGKAKVINSSGFDLTKNFLKGAYEVLKIAKLLNIKFFLFKEKSPACGLNKIYVKNILTSGKGVCSALLIKNGLRGFSL